MNNGIWTRIPSYGLQHRTESEALHAAEIFLRASRVVMTPALKVRTKKIGFAYLARACELACVPLAQHYAETSSGGLDLVWVTYRPEVVPWSESCDPAAMVYLGYVDNLTEDQARSKAIGW